MICRKCLTELTTENCCASFLKIGNKICRKCDLKISKIRLYNNRNTIITNLGGICECCGITNYDFLSINHIHGGGIKDRHSFVSWKKYLKTLVRMPIKELKQSYNCLCYNCNYSLGFWGICAHNLKPISNITVPISNHVPLKKQQDRKLISRRITRIKSKLEMVKAYGSKCSHCGETHPLFLTLDHVNNNGNYNERGVDFYNFLRNLGYPKNGLQLLCHNCNAKKEYIDRRKNRIEIIKTTKEEFVKQDYYITDEQDKELWNNARYLYQQITNK